MQRTLVMLASLALSAAPGGVAPDPVQAGAMVEPALTNGPSLEPLERLLIAVVDAGAVASPTNQPPDDVLAAHLRLADPAASVIVVHAGPDTWTVGPFGVVVVPAPGSAPATALRVDTAMGGATVVGLPVVATGHVAVAEVLGGPEGIVAQRVGDLLPASDELRLPAWQLPEPGTDAVALDGAWWSLRPEGVATAATRAMAAGAVLRTRVTRASPSGLRDLIDASVGDVTGDGIPDLALSFRRPFRRTLLNAHSPRKNWVDARGQSAHVGLFRPTDLSSIWVAGTLVRPVRRLAACTGALAVAYSTLRAPKVVAATAWDWQGFGFLPLPELPGPGRPTCIDIDRDGRPDAAIVERS